jgi:hypothetical protein
MEILINKLFLKLNMDQALVIEILKWVLIVFVAGFIGYFGKHLGKIIISKFNKKKGPVQTIIHQHESPAKYKAEAEKQKAKLEKKKLKIEKKKLKALKKKKK